MKIALVTGSGNGIGLGIAKALLSAGYAVMIADKDAKRAKAAQMELSAFGSVEYIVTDVSSETLVKKMVSATIKKFRGLDVLVNNAAIADPYNEPLEKLPLKAWNAKLNVNLNSVFLCSKYAIPHLRKRNGVIINISSTRALMSEPQSEVYAASKGAMDSLTHAMAVSLGPEIAVHGVRPGWVDTRPQKSRKPLPKSAHQQHPCGRVGEVEDIGALVAYLAKSGRFLTGETITADGGMSRKMIYK